MEKIICGNRITDNALRVDDGSIIIDNALKYIKEKYGWRAEKSETLFSGTYYDSKKVGSYIIKIKNNSQKAVLKIQLRPLLFDEGFIIRHINKQNKNNVIRLPKIIYDEPWSEKLGFGFLIFEDLSGLPNIWQSDITNDVDRKLHALFLKEFLNNVLPIKAWFDAPNTEPKEIYKKSFNHFFEIAAKSDYKHVSDRIVKANKKIYFKIINNFKISPLHFTHGHLSGKDVKYDFKNKKFIIMANLYWSFRPQYYELTFPIWVDIRHISDKNLKLEDVMGRINNWGLAWETILGDKNITNSQQYWFNLLEKSATTIMLDLGTSEWRKEKISENQKQLDVWQELFDWIIKKKFVKV